MAGNRKLTIDVIVDSSGAVQKLRQVDRAVDAVGGKARSATGAVGGLGGGLRSAAALGLGFVGVTTVLAGVSAAIRGAVSASIEMNAKLETSTLQFKSLMGDAGLAEQHVKSLFEFAKRTPFETGPIIEASRLMQTFGGDALNTERNLTLIGDAAAATSAPIQQLGMWTGRLFAALQGGQPIGEATLRMMELGVITPQVVQKMRDMREAGAGANEIFGVFQESLGNFTGSLEDQAETWNGLTSTFWENTKLFIAEKSAPVFDLLKEAIKGANEAFDAINAGPIGRAASQLDRLSAAQVFASQTAARQFEQMGRVEDRLAFQIQTRGRLIAEIKSQQAAEEAASAATEASIPIVDGDAAASKRAAEEAEKFAKSVDRVTGAQQRSLIMTENHIRAVQSVGDTYREEAGRLESFSFGLELVGVQLEAVGRQFDKTGKSAGGFFTGFREGLGDLMSGLTGGSGVSGFLSGIGAGITEGLGQIISGGITGLINAGLGLLGKGIKAIFSIGGPSEAELAGRKTAAAFREGFAASGDHAGFLAGIQEEFIRIGFSAEEAGAKARQFGQDLFAAEAQGPEAVQAVIDAFTAQGAAFDEQIAKLAALKKAEDDLATAQEKRAKIMADTLATGAAAFTEFADSSIGKMVKIPKAFQPIIRQTELLAGEITGPLIRAATAGGVALSSLNTTGNLTGKTFAQTGAGIKAAYHRLIAEGATAKEATEALRGPIAALALAQQDHGFKTDAGTQAIIDQGLKYGITAEEGRTAADKQIKAVDDTIAKLEAMKKFLEEDLADAIRNLPDVEINVTATGGTGGAVAASAGGLVQEFARGGPVAYLAHGGRPRGTDTVPAMLTPGEFVMSRPAVNRLGAGTLAAMNAGGSAGVNVTVNVNGGFMDSPITQRKLSNLVESQLLRTLGQRRSVAGLV